jgi:NADPH:quinone reductase-like Zn-dependent oxidoreductase
MHGVIMNRYGGSEVLEYLELPDPVLADGEVLVRVEAAALNHLDIDLRKGTSRLPLDLPHVLGCEGVGRVVTAAGDATHRWSVGDRVMVLEETTCGRCDGCRRGRQNLCEDTVWIGVGRQGAYAELIAVPADGLIPLPETRSAEEWAAVQGAFGTAWHVLMSRGRLTAGEWVLVNAVGSGVGSAALQVSLLAGAHVIATAGSAAKLERALVMGASEAIDYRSQGTDCIARAVLEATGGRGVDLIFDHVGGSVLTGSLKALRPGGRLVTCGAHAGETVPIDVVELFRSEISLIGSRSCTLAELLTVVELVGCGKLDPVVDSVFALSDVRAAHQRMEQRQQFGKIVLRVP